MNQQRIQEILARIEQVTVAVYGDFCIDAYWMLDPKGSEVSEETGLHARAVARHYYSLGGASKRRRESGGAEAQGDSGDRRGR